MVKSADVILRPAVAADVDALRLVIDSAYEDYRRQGIALPPVSDGLAEDIRDNHVLVAADDTSILGVLIVAIHEDYAHLMNVAVDPKATGRGVGKSLIQVADDIALAAGKTELRLATHRQMPENVSLYRYLGWVMDGSEEDRIYMKRILS